VSLISDSHPIIVERKHEIIGETTDKQEMYDVRLVIRHGQELCLHVNLCSTRKSTDSDELFADNF
jgi:hypothetical protein